MALGLRAGPTKGSLVDMCVTSLDMMMIVIMLWGAGAVSDVPEQKRKELIERKADLERRIDEAPGWGGYVGAMCSELKGVERALASLDAQNSADLPPTREQIMADPRVMALVEVLKTSRDYVSDVSNGGMVGVIRRGNETAYVSYERMASDDLLSIDTALAALTNNEGETE